MKIIFMKKNWQQHAITHYNTHETDTHHIPNYTWNIIKSILYTLDIVSEELVEERLCVDSAVRGFPITKIYRMLEIYKQLVLFIGLVK